jgi:predicted N-acyltransferase
MHTIQLKSASGFTVHIFSAIDLIDKSLWNTISSKTIFYQTHEFLSAVEQLQKNIEFRYVLIYREADLVAALYTQLLDFSFRNLVNYSGKSSGGIKSGIKHYIAKKEAKLLNLGNVFFTGDKGIICRDDSQIIPFIPEIFSLIANTFVHRKPSAFLVANIYLQDEKKCASFYNSAFHPFVTDPDMFMYLNERWSAFDDYLKDLSSKYRVRAKKVLSVSSLIKSKELSVEEIVAHKPDFLKLYNNVVNHVAFNMAVLDIAFFHSMKLMYQERCVIIGYFKNEVMAGFACLFNVDESTLHVHYIGLDYEVNKSDKLYNRMLLDFVKFAIENHKKQIHFGRTATEIKTTIGAVPNPLHAYLKMNNGLVNATLPYFLNRIKPPEFTARNPFKD